MQHMWITVAVCLLIGFVSLGAAHAYDGGTWSGWTRTYPRLIAGLVLTLGSVALLFAAAARLL